MLPSVFVPARRVVSDVKLPVGGVISAYGVIYSEASVLSPRPPVAVSTQTLK